MLDRRLSHLPPDDRILPDVKAWSDVVFIEWQIQARRRELDFRGLKWVFRYSISNKKTKHVLLESSQGVLEWPGTLLSMDEPGGIAMLGTPNGLGVAWLLATHKAQFGEMTVESVRVWATPDSKGKDHYHAAFKIVPLS
jgi:hypothetical protein